MSGLQGAARRLAAGAVGAVSPDLLARIRAARARRHYLREPTAGPRRVLLEPTTGCNHRCIMCWDHSPRLARPTPARHMPFDRLSALLHELRDMGTEEVWLAGRGEPLVHPRATDLLELIGGLGMRSIITTNAGLLTEDMADRLPEWGVQQLSVSIDSGTPETYARVHGAKPQDRARILGLLRRLSQRGDAPHLLVSMVLSQWNFRDLPDLVRDAIEAGVSGIVIGGMRPVPFESGDLALSDADWAQVRRDIETARNMAQAASVDVAVDNVQTEEAPRSQQWPYQEMACFIGHLFSLVDVNGNVHGCCTCQNALGSLEEASFREIWWSRPYHLFRRILREMPSTGLTPPQCECRHGCGHIPENAQLQRELGFRFQWRGPESEFATRMDAGREICRRLDAVLPTLSSEYAFADLTEESERTAASRLRQVGAMGGIGWMDGLALFEPLRLVARGEFAGILRGALRASGCEEAEAQRLAEETQAGSGHRAEPLTKSDMTRWVSAAAERLSERAG